MPNISPKNRAVKIMVFCVNLLLMGVAVLVMRSNDQKKSLQADPNAENSLPDEAVPSSDQPTEDNSPTIPSLNIDPGNAAEGSTSNPAAISNPVPASDTAPAPSATTKKTNPAPSNAKTKTS